MWSLFVESKLTLAEQCYPVCSCVTALNCNRSSGGGFGEDWLDVRTCGNPIALYHAGEHGGVTDWNFLNLCWIKFQVCYMSNSLDCPLHQVLQMGALYLLKETSLEIGIVRPRSCMRAVIQLLALLFDSLAKQHIYLWWPQRTSRWEANWRKCDSDLQIQLASESSSEQSPNPRVSSVVLYAFSERLSSPGTGHSWLWIALFISQWPLPGSPVHCGRKWMCVPLSTRRTWPMLCLRGTKADCPLVSGVPHHCLQGPKDFPKVGLFEIDEFFFLIHLHALLWSFALWSGLRLSDIVEVDPDPCID